MIESPTRSAVRQANRPSPARRLLDSLQSSPLPWEIAPAAALALALVLIYFRSAPVVGLPFDDSYISLLFARNLAHHGILTFDGKTASAGATSILHVALLAVPIKLGIDPTKASLGLGIALQLGLVGAVYWLARTMFHDRLAAFFAAIGVAVTGYLAFDALNGMETTLFLLVTTATAAAYFRARTDRDYLIAGMLGAVSVLTRPEAALLLVSMALYEAIDPQRSTPLVSIATVRRLALLGAPAVVVLGALAIFYGATTGSITPGTATAKVYFFREFELPWQARGDLTQAGLTNFIAPLAPFFALAALSIRRRETLLFAFFWAGLMFAYFMLFPGGLSHYWYRYQHVFLPPLLVFAGAGLASLIRAVRWRSGDALAAAVIGAVLIAGILFQYNNFRNHYVDEVSLNDTRGIAMARYLRDTLPPGATVATHDIGDVGYFSGHPVIDLVGLVNPDVVEYHSGRRLRQYVDRTKPDYVVLFPSWEFAFLHLALDPFVFETVREFPGANEPYILYRTHFAG
ncbi:MAG: hypothetical protein GZ089_10490 [Aromatoleum sp.]|nr:hypothetical protein [Aromatoleum sp.]